MATVHVDTQEYTYEHGRTPRGFGGWMFTFERDGETVEVEKAFYGTYTASLKNARRYAAGMGYDAIVVLP